MSGSYYVTEIVSHGEHPESKRENTGTLVWTDRVDYFVKSRENINKVLTTHLTRRRLPNERGGVQRDLAKGWC